MNCISCESEIPENSHLGLCETCFRETVGKRVREIWVNYCLKIGNHKPSNIAPWQELTEHDKEVDREIGEELFKAGVESSNGSLLSLLKDVTQTILIVALDLTDSEKIANKHSWFHYREKWGELLEDVAKLFDERDMVEFYKNIYEEVISEN